MVRVHFSALSSEQVCSSLSRIKKNGAKDEGRTDNQLRVRAQALQPERPRGGTVNPKRRTMLTWRAKRRGMPKGLQATGSGHRTFPEKQLLSH